MVEGGYETSIKGLKTPQSVGSLRRLPPFISFKRQEFEDFEFIDVGNQVGAIRVKASGMLWQLKGTYSWYRIRIEFLPQVREENYD
jgi:hypothetical protein